ATIYVERDSQKSIIIGKNGSMIKKIGELARADIEQFLSRHIRLETWVKVYEKWKKDPQALREMGYSD
ncbi:MAG: KH domain-containing protein, partial [Candidatus Omnitrophota bacterium]